MFLILAAQFESWSLPFSVLLGTPTAILGAFLALTTRGFENNVYAQIGLIMLIGLAAKNAILIVAFAKTEYEHGKLPYKDHGKPESILDIALNNNIFLDHACGGNCACTTCHVHVIKGKELLSEIDDDEADRLDMAADLQLNSRLGCQVVIEKPGEIVVEIPAWNRNYVSEGH